MPMPDTDAVALDAYSQVVTSIAAELTPRVAAVNVSRRRSDGRVGGTRRAWSSRASRDGTDPRPASRAGGVVEGLAVRPDRSSTPKRVAARQSSARSSSQALGPAALRPATTSRSWVWLGLTSTIEVHHCWVRQRPVRQNNASSRPSALTSPMRPVSASMSAAPYAITASLTVCQSQPSSRATVGDGAAQTADPDLDSRARRRTIRRGGRAARVRARG
jgi:hypothetical protein